MLGLTRNDYGMGSWRNMNSESNFRSGNCPASAGQNREYVAFIISLMTLLIRLECNEYPLEEPWVDHKKVIEVLHSPTRTQSRCGLFGHLQISLSHSKKRTKLRRRSTSRSLSPSLLFFVSLDVCPPSSSQLGM